MSAPDDARFSITGNGRKDLRIDVSQAQFLRPGNVHSADGWKGGESRISLRSYK